MNKNRENRPQGSLIVHFRSWERTLKTFHSSPKILRFLCTSFQTSPSLFFFLFPQLNSLPHQPTTPTSPLHPSPILLQWTFHDSASATPPETPPEIRQPWAWVKPWITLKIDDSGSRARDRLAWTLRDLYTATGVPLRWSWIYAGAGRLLESANFMRLLRAAQTFRDGNTSFATDWIFSFLQNINI